MTKVQPVRPLITWTLLAFAIVVAFAVVILVPVWLQPPLSKADLSAVPAGEKRVALQQAQGQPSSISAVRASPATGPTGSANPRAGRSRAR